MYLNLKKHIKTVLENKLSDFLDEKMDDAVNVKAGYLNVKADKTGVIISGTNKADVLSQMKELNKAKKMPLVIFRKGKVYDVKNLADSFDVVGYTKPMGMIGSNGVYNSLVAK